MVEMEALFATRVYRAKLVARGLAGLNRRLEAEALALAADDAAGRAWAREKGYRGYTSYASLDDLAWRSPSFAELADALLPHAEQFAKALHFSLARPLTLDSLWVNVLEPGGRHTSHIHPHAVLSGTYYVAMPAGAAPLLLEDPRLALMMAAPAVKARAPRAFRRHVEMSARPGTVLLWESYLRHEVGENRAKGPRISVSFNFA